MAVFARVAGTMEVAAALAFHLPGARLDLSGPNGTRCSVGPLTDPRCNLHPAEFREMIVATGSGELFGSTMGWALGDSPALSLTTVVPGVEHLGAGLYRVEGGETTSYAFATPLPARRVDTLLSGLHPDRFTVCHTDESESSGDGAEWHDVIGVSLIQDDGLSVTLVVMCTVEGAESTGASVARAAVSACLVAEMEHMGTEPDGLAD